jgi:hypothetical protein
MKTQWVYLLAGLLVGVTLTLVVGASSSNVDVGRFAVSAWNDRVYVIDTATGELWIRSGGKVRSFGTLDDPGPGPLTTREASPVPR